MTTRKLSTLFLSLALCAVYGCGKAEVTPIRVTGDMTVSTIPGSEIKLELEANPTTGYAWSVKESEKSGVVSMAREAEYVPSSDRLVGSGGQRIYTFKARRRGEENIVFEYARPWEKGKEPARRYTVLITVR
jgi:inhibitor of cysteine peptidase